MFFQSPTNPFLKNFVSVGINVLDGKPMLMRIVFHFLKTCIISNTCKCVFVKFEINEVSYLDNRGQ